VDGGLGAAAYLQGIEERKDEYEETIAKFANGKVRKQSATHQLEAAKFYLARQATERGWGVKREEIIPETKNKTLDEIIEGLKRLGIKEDTAGE